MLATFFSGFTSFVKQSFVLLAEEAEDEETVDPQEVLRDKYRPQCAKYSEELDKCNQRVRSRKNTAETCWIETVDLAHCIDYRVAKELFSKLK